MRAAGERLDIQGLRVLPVDPVPNAAQPREVAQALRRGECARPRGVTHNRTPFIDVREHLGYMPL